MRRAGLMILIFFVMFMCAVSVFAQDVPKNITHSNIFWDRFVISWTTENVAVAQINYGTTPALGSTVYDVRGEAFEGTTHYISVTGLTAATTYYYDVVCGGIVYDNNGAHYTITTGSILSPADNSDIAYGQVFLVDGATPAKDSIIYVKLRNNNDAGTSGESQLFSCLVDSNGYWYVDLKNIKTSSLNAYFDYSNGDNLVITAKGTNGGSTISEVDTAASSPVAPIIITVSQTVSISIDRADWQLLNIAAGSEQITDGANKIMVTNDGDGSETYSLKIANAGGWLNSTDKNGADIDTFVLSAIFAQSSQSNVTPSYFNEAGSDDVILSATADKATSARFASSLLSDNGVSVPTGAVRSLWFDLKAPLKDTTKNTAHFVSVTISAEAS